MPPIAADWQMPSRQATVPLQPQLLLPQWVLQSSTESQATEQKPWLQWSPPGISYAQVVAVALLPIRRLTGGAQPLPGRAFADVNPIRGNFIRKAVRWSNGTSLNNVTGTQLRLRVAMTDAKLYSATFRCRAPKQHTTSQMAMH